MRQSAVLLLVLFTLAFGTACGGGSKVIPPAGITVTPATVSIVAGRMQQLSAVAHDPSLTQLTTATFSFATSNAAVADVSTTGLVCGGKWDNPAAPVVCTAGSPTGTATITVTATVDKAQPPSVSTTVNVFVHPSIDSVVISPPSGVVDCHSQAEVGTYTAVACSGTAAVAGSACPRGENVTAFAGPPDWTVSPSAIATPSTSGTCTTFDSANNAYHCDITASLPGLAAVSARVGATVSSPVPFIACPVGSIHLQDANQLTSVSLAAAGTATLSPTVKDTKGVTLATLPTLNYNTSQPTAVSVSSAGSNASSITATANIAGGSTIVASCTPPSCNAGMYPVFSNPYTVSVSGTTSTTAYVASKNSTSMFPITTASNAVGTAVTLNAKPNSLVVSPLGNKVLLGTNAGETIPGLMVYDLSATPATLSTVGPPGKVLAVSPDGNNLIVFFGADEGNAGAPPVAFVFNLTVGVRASIALKNAKAARAAFSPDSSHAYVTATTQVLPEDPVHGLLAVWSATTAPLIFELTNPANDVAFLAQGSFAYLAGGDTGNVGVYATCGSGQTPWSGLAASEGVPGVPKLIAAMPNGTQLVAADALSMDLITATTDGATNFNSGPVCAITDPRSPSVTNTAVSSPAVTGFTAPLQILVASDNSKALILNDDAGVPVVVYNLADNTTSTIALTGGGHPDHRRDHSRRGRCLCWRRRQRQQGAPHQCCCGNG